MIDYLMTFTDEATAKADPVVGAFAPNGNWRMDIVVPHLQTWNPSGDTTTQVPNPNPPPATIPQTVHAYHPGFWLCIVQPAQVPALDNHSAMVMVLDEAAAGSGAPVAQYVKKFNPSLFPSIISLIQTAKWQPHILGRQYTQLLP